MMNYAGMLVEARGVNDVPLAGDASKVTSRADATKLFLQSRIRDLKLAESLYSKVAAHGSVMAQQQQAQPAASTKKDDEGQGNPGQQMTAFAQEALGTVQNMIRDLLDKIEASAKS
jgi:hypothetical protein